MDKTQLLALAQKYLQGTASEEEIRLLHEWYDAAGEEEIEMVFTGQPETEQDISHRIFAGLQQKMQPTPAKVRRMNRTKWMAAAAVLILIGAAAGYMLMQSPAPQKPAIVKNKVPQKIQDVQPGGDKATLTLADGSIIVLDSAQNGTITQQGYTVVKKNGGQLRYDASHSPLATGHTPYNTITTPRGGQYQVVLPDGSQVWLNAASSLRFPAVFTGKERKVEVTGEAYFEVAKDRHKPFKVAILPSAAEVEVLGTHFNIMAYEDEKNIQTTLLEGKVKVVNNETAILNPGQQAVITQQAPLKVRNDVDLEAVLAWKNGMFSFNSMDIQSIMRQIARWYNLEVAYSGDMRTRTFSGEVSRNINISGVLKVLETGGVHFKLEGSLQPGQTAKIIVLP